jgi:hypothetical protein
VVLLGLVEKVNINQQVIFGEWLALMLYESHSYRCTID